MIETIGTSLPRIRWATPGDADGFVALLNGHYRRQITADYVHWQFFDAKYPGRLAVAEFDARIVAVQGARVVRTLNDAACEPLVTIIDSLVAEPWRGAGLYSALVDFVATDTGAVAKYCLPNAVAEPLLTRFMGWQRVAQILTFAGPTQVARVPALDVIEWPSFAGPVGDEASRLASHATRNIVMGRSAEWLRWRFDRQPMFGYHRLAMHRAGRLVGWAVVKRFVDPVTNAVVGDLVDFACASDDDALTLDVLAAAARFLCQQQIEAWTLWSHDHEFIDLVARLGLQPIGAALRFLCVRPMAPAGERFCAGRDWRLTMADAEFT